MFEGSSGTKQRAGFNLHLAPLSRTSFRACSTYSEFYGGAGEPARKRLIVGCAGSRTPYRYNSRVKPLFGLSPIPIKKNPASWVGVRKFCKYKSSCFTSECYNNDLINLFSRYQQFSI